MKKKSLLILLVCISLVVVYYGIHFFTTGSNRTADDGIFTKDTVFGSNNVKLRLKAIGLANSKISKNFTTALTEKTKLLLENQSLQLDIEFIGLPESRNVPEIIAQIKESNLPTIIVFSPEVILTKDSHKHLIESQIPTFLFSSDAYAVCDGEILSHNIWNFGLPLKSFAETYLSFVNQKYGQLAKDLDIFIYVNDDKKLLEHSAEFEKVIKGLGLKVDGKLIVDERQDDLYTTVRQVFDYDPRIIVGIMGRRGLQKFLSISSRLSLTFDMGVSVIEGAFEEDLVDSGENSRAIIVPSAYVYGASELSGDYKITTSMYQGLLVGGFLEKFFFRGLGDDVTFENINEKIETLDGVRYEGLSGLATFDSKTHGLIQPIHVGEFKEGRLNHVQYLGDVSLAANEMCVY